MRSFAATMEQFIRQTLREGLYGWQSQTAWCRWSGPNTAFPMGLRRNGTAQWSPGLPEPHATGGHGGAEAGRHVVCEPIHRFRLDTLADTLTCCCLHCETKRRP